jgi:putative sterol carrier protein
VTHVQPEPARRLASAQEDQVLNATEFFSGLLTGKRNPAAPVMLGAMPLGGRECFAPVQRGQRKGRYDDGWWLQKFRS